jgi:hypothetical protein
MYTSPDVPGMAIQPILIVSLEYGIQFVTGGLKSVRRNVFCAVESTLSISIEVVPVVEYAVCKGMPRGRCVG